MNPDFVLASILWLALVIATYAELRGIEAERTNYQRGRQ